jgi:anion-transporting  ArsA/GET3 family ATPase
VCCGSGGVGKTTSAAALGLQAALLGRRAVVVTIDPAKRLADALGVPGGLGNEPTKLDVPARAGELWALMLDTATTFDGWCERTPPTPSRPNASWPTASTATWPAR